jgi:hypothetical protein
MMKNSVTFVVELHSSRCLVLETARRRLSRGSTDPLLGVENTSRHASCTLRKFPIAATLLNVILVRLRYLRLGASISRQAPTWFSTRIVNHFKENDDTRSLAKDLGQKKSFRCSRMGQPERSTLMEFKSKSPMSSRCNTFSDGKQIFEESCNCNPI